MDTSEISNTSLEDTGDDKKRKVKKRSMVERELETNLTSRFTSPLKLDDSTSSRSRYGRALKTKPDNIELEKDADSNKSQTQTNEINSDKLTPTKSPIEKRIEMLYKQNISLSRFNEDNKDSSDKLYVQKDLIQNETQESATKKSSHLNNILERSSDKYSLSKNYDIPSVVKVIDFSPNGSKDKDEIELVKVEGASEYQVNDMAWARIGSFPFWPCIVSRDPYTDLFVKKKAAGKGETSIFHVIFFGDNGRRGWVSNNMLRKYEGLQEFESAQAALTPELKKKDPKLYAAFIISEKRHPKWKLSVDEAELIYKQPKMQRLECLNDILMKNNDIKVTPNTKELAKISRKGSDVSLSESLYDTLFSEDDSRADDSEVNGKKYKRAPLDVSEVVTACLDDMAAKTGLTKIRKQSHMDRWLLKAKSKTPEKGNRLSISKKRENEKKNGKQKKTSNKNSDTVSAVFSSSTETSKEENSSSVNNKLIIPKKVKRVFSQLMNDSLSTENDLIQNILIGELSNDSLDVNTTQTDLHKSLSTTTSEDENKKSKPRPLRAKVTKITVKKGSVGSDTIENTSINNSTGTDISFIESPISKKNTRTKIAKSTPIRRKKRLSTNNDTNSTGDENLPNSTIESITDEQLHKSNKATLETTRSTSNNTETNGKILNVQKTDIVEVIVESERLEESLSTKVKKCLMDNKVNVAEKTTRRSSKRGLSLKDMISNEIQKIDNHLNKIQNNFIKTNDVGNEVINTEINSKESDDISKSTKNKPKSTRRCSRRFQAHSEISDPSKEVETINLLEPQNEHIDNNINNFESKSKIDEQQISKLNATPKRRSTRNKIIFDIEETIRTNYCNLNENIKEMDTGEIKEISLIDDESNIVDKITSINDNNVKSPKLYRRSSLRNKTVNKTKEIMTDASSLIEEILPNGQIDNQSVENNVNENTIIEHRIEVDKTKKEVVNTKNNLINEINNKDVNMETKNTNAFTGMVSQDTEILITKLPEKVKEINEQKTEENVADENKEITIKDIEISSSGRIIEETDTTVKEEPNELNNDINDSSTFNTDITMEIKETIKNGTIDENLIQSSNENVCEQKIINETNSDVKNIHENVSKETTVQINNNNDAINVIPKVSRSETTVLETKTHDVNHIVDNIISNNEFTLHKSNQSPRTYTTSFTEVTPSTFSTASNEIEDGDSDDGSICIHSNASLDYDSDEDIVLSYSPLSALGNNDTCIEDVMEADRSGSPVYTMNYSVEKNDINTINANQLNMSVDEVGDDYAHIPPMPCMENGKYKSKESKPLNGSVEVSHKKHYSKNIMVNGDCDKKVEGQENIDACKDISNIDLEIPVYGKVNNITIAQEDISISKEFNLEYSNPKFLKYVELNQDSLIDENPAITENEIYAYLFKTWTYEQSLKVNEMKDEEEMQSNLLKPVPKSNAPKAPKNKKGNKKSNDYLVDRTTRNKNDEIITNNLNTKLNAEVSISKPHDDTKPLNHIDTKNTNTCFKSYINNEKPMKDVKNKDYKNKEFLKYVSINQDALLDEHPDLTEDEILAYLYKTWTYENQNKSQSFEFNEVSSESEESVLSEDSALQNNDTNILTSKSKPEIVSLNAQSMIESSEYSDNNETRKELKVRDKDYKNSEFLKYVELKQDTILEENPKLTKDEIHSYLFKTWSYEQELKSDDMKLDEIKESNLIKGQDEIEKSKTKKKIRKSRKVLSESSDDDTDFEPSQKLRQHLRLKKNDKVNEKSNSNGMMSWLTKHKDIKMKPKDVIKPNKLRNQNVISINDNIRELISNEELINAAQVEVDKIEKAMDVEILEANAQAVTAKKYVETLSLNNPEFLKYVELRQDALVDEFPDLSEENVMTYLFKTWSYEEKLKSEEVKNDDLQQSTLVKGLGEEPSAPVKRVNKKKVEKNVNKNYESDDVNKEKPKRKAAKAYYNEIDSFSDSDGLDNLDENGRPVAYSKAKDSGENSDYTEEVVYDDIEYFFHQMTQPKPNIFKGLLKEKVCEICEKTSNLVKCTSCAEMFHLNCVKNQTSTVVEQVLVRGRKKKKPKSRKLKNENDAEENSEDINGDLNKSIEDHDKSLEDLKTIEIRSNVEDFEAQLEAKMKEIINPDVLYDSQYTSEEELDWNNSVAGQCEIVDFKLKPKSMETCYSDFKCNDCQKNDTPLCFVCKGKVSPKSGVELRQKCSVSQCLKYYHIDCLDHWPQTQINSGELTRHSKKQKQLLESIICPRHVCHTCVCDDPRGCKTRFSSDKLAKCVRCPAVYHSFTKCLPAGSRVLSAAHIICPRHYEHKPGRVPCHVNTGWCFICALGGTLICCEYCPMSFHAECLNIKPPEGGYMCEDCETGRLPLYGEMVWVKLGNYRWWPGLILHPSEIPENVLALKHYLGEFVVRFFGQYDHYWVNRGRVFPFQEGDTGKVSSQKNKIDAAFTRAIEDAKRGCEVMKSVVPNVEESLDIQSSLLAPHYVKLKVNKPCGSVINWRPDDSEANSLTQCECDPNDIEPCGPDSQCLNRMLLTECGPTCRAGDRCYNRNFEKRIYPKMVAHRTPHRGWGLKTLEPIRKGQFVIEYVGELIDEEELRRRMTRKHEIRDENFYFLTLDKDRIIDAGPKGNLARFMNHSCEPNCETQKWTVLGDVRVGLFAIDDIPANTEVNFNYNFECAGIKKKQCMCGAKRCSGYIGAKPKQDDPKRLKLVMKQKRVYKKRKTTEPKARGRPKTKRELTEIEKDLLIIKSASNNVENDSEDSQNDSENIQIPLKRKGGNISTDEIYDLPLMKKCKVILD